MKNVSLKSYALLKQCSFLSHTHTQKQTKNNQAPIVVAESRSKMERNPLNKTSFVD